MKILAVAPRSEAPPIGLAYVVAAMKHAGHEVDCLNLTLGDTLEIPREEYSVVATGGLACHYRELQCIAREAKKAGAVLVMGGGIITSEPELMIRALEVDYGVIGEGEDTILDLLACIEQGTDPGSVASIGFVKDGAFQLTPSRGPILDLDRLPFPDYESFGLERALELMRPSDFWQRDIFDYPRVYTVVSSRSCPYQCTFCYHPLGNKYRQRSIDNVMNELKAAIPRHRINIVEIADELFSHNEERLVEFCAKFKEYIATLPWEIVWFCQLRVDKLKEEHLDMLIDANCHFVSFGFESYSAEILKSMKKHITPEQIHRAVHLVLERRLSMIAAFIFGDRAETQKTYRETLSFWKEHAQAGILMALVMPFPASELYLHCIERGLIKDRLDFIADHLFDPRNMTAMSDDEYFRMHVEILKAILQHHPYAVAISYRDETLTVRCPHCRKVTSYRNFDAAAQDKFTSMLALPRSKLIYHKMLTCRACRRKLAVRSPLFNLYLKAVLPIFSPFVLGTYIKLRKFLTRWRNARKGG